MTRQVLERMNNKKSFKFSHTNVAVFQEPGQVCPKAG